VKSTPSQHRLNTVNAGPWHNFNPRLEKHWPFVFTGVQRKAIIEASFASRCVLRCRSNAISNVSAVAAHSPIKAKRSITVQQSPARQENNQGSFLSVHCPLGRHIACGFGSYSTRRASNSEPTRLQIYPYQCYESLFSHHQSNHIHDQRPEKTRRPRQPGKPLSDDTDNESVQIDLG
jgi:hypothetical protein